MSKGNLYLIPTPIGGESQSDVLPIEVQKKTIELRHFIVENVKTARRFLRKIDPQFPIDESTFFELNKRTSEGELLSFIKPLKEGFDLGVMSEAGCPGIADPGAAVVSLAHKKGYRIKPLVGPSSILLTLMGSGFSGQEFIFHGYLPKDRKDRIHVIKNFESDVRRTGKTHLFMDTPFRNMNVLDDLLNELSDTTFLCIGSNMTYVDENIRSMSVLDWREHAYDLSKKPTIFAIGTFQ